MAKPSVTPASVAEQIRRMLRQEGSDQHAAGVQWFFKDEIKSHGWYTAALRKAARACRKQILSEHDLKFLVKVADQLFDGAVLEERVFAIFLLENLASQFGNEEFALFERWLGRIASWADHDGLVHYLIAPMVADQPERTVAVFRWAKSKNRWARRAACVALIRGSRKKQFFRETLKLTEILIADEDDIVQKGLGWLWRETAKFDPKRAVHSLLDLGKTMPRQVLRTACETLPADVRTNILLRTKTPNR